MASQVLFAQQSDYKTTFSDAEYYFLFQDYKEALPLYLSIYDESSDNANLQYRIGLCYFNIPGLKFQAVPYLEGAVKKINHSYQEGSYKETGAPANAYFYLGEAYRVAGKLEKALEAYNTFKNTLDTKDVYNLDYVNQQIRACELAAVMAATPVQLTSEALDLFDETKYLFNPVVSADGNTMIFTVQEKFYDGIFWVKKDDGKWGIPVNITLDIGVEGEVYSTSINEDGTKVFLYKNDKGTGNLYCSNLVDGRWQPVTKLGKNVSSRSWETHASISPDGQHLFFTSTRKGGYGGLDIYVSKLNSDGEWGPAINLGPTINTAHNEECPFLSPDGEYLYFSSQGHNSMGGYDIYFSQKDANENWVAPINMGYPINTPDDELFYFPMGKEKGIMAKVEEGNPDSRQIYMLSIGKVLNDIEVPIEGKIRLTDNNEIQGEGIRIRLVSTEPDSIIGQVNPENVSGLFFFNVEPGSYKIVAEADNYANDTVTFIIPENFNQPSFNVNISLTPKKVAEGEYLAIKSILFDFDKAELNRDAEFEIEKVLNFLQKYPELTIEVSGHTDSKGSVAYNQKLSLQRAQSVIDYLSERGISSNRLVPRGASVFENVAANYKPDGTDNPEGRSLNRRVCITVLNKDSGVRIEEDFTVPEHLKPRDQSYTILLASVGEEVSETVLMELKNKANVEPIRKKGITKQFAHVVGSFPHKSHAIELLNYCIDNGFPRATIIGEQDLTNLLALTPNFEKKETKLTENKFTIEVYANAQPVEDFSQFKELSVKEVKGKDAMYRYIYGEFMDKGLANKELKRIKELGFDDAFIANLSRYIE